jgi:hypothetical protein
MVRTGTMAPTFRIVLPPLEILDSTHNMTAITQYLDRRTPGMLLVVVLHTQLPLTHGLDMAVECLLCTLHSQVFTTYHTHLITSLTSVMRPRMRNSVSKHSTGHFRLIVSFLCTSNKYERRIGNTNHHTRLRLLVPDFIQNLPSSLDRSRQETRLVR